MNRTRGWLIGAWVVLGGGLGLALPLRQTPFPDGTGSIGLPAGWQIAASYRGSVQCTGGGGVGVALGIAWPIVPPDHPTVDLARGRPVVRQGDVAGALREVLAKQFQARLLGLRSRPAPPAVGGVPAYYLLYEFAQDGVRYTAIGYFTSLTHGPREIWQLYSSAIIAPTGSFAREYPTLMAVWRSWRPNGQAPLAESQSGQLERMLRGHTERLDRIRAAFN